MATLIDKTHEPSARRICDRHRNRPDALIEILHEVQAEQKFLSDGALRTIADCLNLSRAEIHGVVTFYHDFKRTKPASHSVRLCRAEACQAVGSEALAAHAEQRLKAATGGRSVDGKVDLEAVYCLGNCALGPSAMIDGKLYGRLDAARLDTLIAALGGAH